MLWKELHIERVGTLGRFGKGIGLLLVLLLGGGSLTLAGVIAWNRWMRPDPAWERWGVDLLADAIGQSAPYLGYLLQWSIGLRAAVSISSERERGTWDALLTSPLDGTEIILGKLWGSLYALRWLAGSAALGWTIALAFGALRPSEYLIQCANTLVIGAFMAAVGVRCSLATATATKAMSLTMGAWLLMRVLAAIVAVFLFAIGGLLWMLGSIAAQQYGLVSSTGGVGFPLPIAVVWAALNLSAYALAGLLIATETRLRFDRIAGRQAEGRVGVAVRSARPRRTPAADPTSPIRG